MKREKKCIKCGIKSTSNWYKGPTCIKCYRLPNISNYNRRSRDFANRQINLGLCQTGCGKKLKSKSRCQECLNKHNKDSKNRRRQLRIKALQHYGGKCNCCGETAYGFLTFEHKNGDGAEHRRKIWHSGGGNMAHWLIKNNYPDFIEILCYNCNCSKWNLGQCPHKTTT